jgi:hypothetical protein
MNIFEQQTYDPRLSFDNSQLQVADLKVGSPLNNLYYEYLLRM